VVIPLDKIKSAYEMAMERFQQRDEVPKKEIDRLDSIPVGKAMAAAYIRENNYDLIAEISKQPAENRKYIIEGIHETFINNIQLPMEQHIADQNKRVMSGMLSIVENVEEVAAVFVQLTHLFNYYEQVSTQAYGQMKDAYRAKVMESARKIGNNNITEESIDPERYAGFREEWLRTRTRLNEQYQGALKESKDNLRKVII